MNSITTTRSSAQLRLNIGRIGLYVILIVMAIIFLFPIIWSALYSFKTPEEAIAIPPTYLPSTISFENYEKLFKYGAGVWQYVFNSSMVTIYTIIGTIVLSTVGGYGFSRFDFPGKNALFILVLMTLMIPYQALLTPLYIFFVKVNLNDTLLGLALVYITWQLPFGVFLMRNTFDMVPREIEEAALLDGCNTLEMLWRVMIKIVSPGIVTVAIFTFINAWNEFLAALILMSNNKNYTLPIMLKDAATGQNHQAGAHNIDYGVLQAGVMVNIIPCLILFLILQRYYIKGLMGGSVK